MRKIYEYTLLNIQDVKRKTAYTITKNVIHKFIKKFEISDYMYVYICTYIFKHTRQQHIFV